MQLLFDQPVLFDGLACKLRGECWMIAQAVSDITI